MSWTRRSVVTGLGAATLAGCTRRGSQSQPPVAPRRVRVVLPHTERMRLANGASLYFSEDRGVPLVALGVTIPAGLRHDPDETPGVAGVAADLLLDTRNRGRTQRFAALGTTLLGDVGDTTTALRCVVARQDAPAAVQLLVDAIRSLPTDAAAFERVRSDRIGALESVRGDPFGVAGLGIVHGAHGSRPPTRTMATGTPASLRDMSIGYVRQWHAIRAQASAASFAVAGDTDPDEARRWVEDACARWPADGSADGSAAGPRPAGLLRVGTGPRVVLVPWPRSQQCTVAFGGRRQHGDSTDARTEAAADAILGGVVHYVLRTDQRLTYGLRSDTWSTRAGAVRYKAVTVNPFDVGPAVHPINNLTEWVSRRVTLTAADVEGLQRDAMVRLMHRSIGPQARLSRLLAWADAGQDPPTARQELKAIESLTLAKLESAARRLSRPDNQRICIVGDAETIAHAASIVGPEGVVEVAADALVDEPA